MKKRILAVLLCAVMILSFAACSNNKNGDEYYNYDLTPYFELGEYKNLEIELYSTDATEEEINTYADYFIKNTVFYDKVDKAAEKGDMVYLDYQGKLNGEVFQGGTAEKQMLTLGSAGFIDGFEDAIVGMKAGEVRDINVTFPEDYGSEELAGKPAVFTITFHAVVKEFKGEAELTDEFLSTHICEEGYSSVEALKTICKEEIEVQKQKNELAQNKDKIITTIRDKGEFKKLPETDIKRNYEAIKKSFEDNYNQYSSAGYFSGSMVDFINEYSGYNVETVDEFYNKYAEDQVKIEVVLKAVANAEGIKAEPSEIEEITSQWQAYQFESEAAFLEEMGGIEYVEWYVLFNKTIDWLVDNTTWVDASGNKVEYPAPTAAPAE